jgi:hypothetical protein
MSQSSISPEKIRSTIASVMLMLKLGVQYTPTTVDDRVVKFLEPIVTDEHFAAFLSQLIEAFDGKTPTIKDVLAFMSEKGE